MRRAATAVAGAVLVLLAVALFVRPGKVAGDLGDVAPATGRDIPATLHLVAAGTSLTSRGFWPDDLGARLGRCLGVPVVVDRVAKAGANSDWGLAQVPGIVALSPDLVLIEFAINDADMLDGVALERSRGNLRAIIAGVRDGQPEALIVVASTNPVSGLRGAKRPFLGEYFAAARSVAEGTGAAFFDGTARWRADPQPGDLSDGLHPADAAAARVVAPALASFLGAAYGKDC
jgi:lysophospholipase L1-like esterase